MPQFDMTPYLLWYTNNNPELFSRSFTAGELILIMAVATIIVAIVVVSAILLYQFIERYFR